MIAIYGMRGYESDVEDSVMQFEIKTVQIQFHKSLVEPQVAPVEVGTFTNGSIQTKLCIERVPFGIVQTF